MKIAGPIILVDDDEDDHEIIRAVCTQLGVCDLFRHFKNAFELIDYLKNTGEQPFIILCDINMPKMDGLQLRAELIKDEKLRKKSIPFIFYSTAASIHQVEQAYNLTVQGFFVKGNTIKETEDRLRRILEYWCDCKHPNAN